MIENLDILYGVAAQSLTFDAPDGQPTSVVASDVYENSHGDENDTESALTGSASISAVSTTFDGNSGASEGNPVILRIASTVGIAVGARLIAETAAGKSEIIEVRKIIDGESLECRSPLQNSYVTGDTLKGLTVSHALDASWVSEKSNISDASPSPRYRWRCEYVSADGKTHVHHAYFDLVRYSADTQVTGLDVDANYPWLDFFDRLPVADKEDRGTRIIEAARRQVKLKLFHAGKADEAMRNREVMEDLILHRAAFIAAGSDLDAREAIAANFDAAYNNFILAGKAESDSDGSGAARPSKPAPVMRR